MKYKELLNIKLNSTYKYKSDYIYSFNGICISITYFIKRYNMKEGEKLIYTSYD